MSILIDLYEQQKKKRPAATPPPKGTGTIKPTWDVPDWAQAAPPAKTTLPTLTPSLDVLRQQQQYQLPRLPIAQTTAPVSPLPPLHTQTYQPQQQPDTVTGAAPKAPQAEVAKAIDTVHKIVPTLGVGGRTPSIPKLGALPQPAPPAPVAMPQADTTQHIPQLGPGAEPWQTRSPVSRMNPVAEAGALETLAGFEKQGIGIGDRILRGAQSTVPTWDEEGRMHVEVKPMAWFSTAVNTLFGTDLPKGYVAPKWYSDLLPESQREKDMATHEKFDQTIDKWQKEAHFSKKVAPIHEEREKRAHEQSLLTGIAVEIAHDMQEFIPRIMTQMAVGGVLGGTPLAGSTALQHGSRVAAVAFATASGEPEEAAQRAITMTAYSMTPYVSRMAGLEGVGTVTVDALANMILSSPTYIKAHKQAGGFNEDFLRVALPQLAWDIGMSLMTRHDPALVAQRKTNAFYQRLAKSYNLPESTVREKAEFVPVDRKGHVAGLVLEDTYRPTIGTDIRVLSQHQTALKEQIRANPDNYITRDQWERFDKATDAELARYLQHAPPIAVTHSWHGDGRPFSAEALRAELGMRSVPEAAKDIVGSVEAEYIGWLRHKALTGTAADKKALNDFIAREYDPAIVGAVKEIQRGEGSFDKMEKAYRLLGRKTLEQYFPGRFHVTDDIREMVGLWRADVYGWDERNMNARNFMLEQIQKEFELAPSAVVRYPDAPKGTPRGDVAPVVERMELSDAGTITERVHMTVVPRGLDAIKHQEVFQKEYAAAKEAGLGIQPARVYAQLRTLGMNDEQAKMGVDEFMREVGQYKEAGESDRVAYGRAWEALSKGARMASDAQEIADIKEQVDELGNFTMPGDTLTKALEVQSTDAIIELMQWSAGQSPHVKRNVTGTAAAVLRERGVPVDSIEWQQEYLYPAATTSAVEADTTPAPTDTIPGAPETADVDLAGRRRNMALRAEIDSLSPEDKDEVIRSLREYHFTDDMTGLRNRAAYMTDDSQPFQAVIDLDNLKWFNDNINHTAGDTLIKTFADALPREAYHISGDEFIVKGQSKEELQALMTELEQKMAQAAMSFPLDDGRTVGKEGIGFSYGIGETQDQAETGLQKHKQAREKEGVRSARGKTPPGVTGTEEAPVDTGTHTMSIAEAKETGRPASDLAWMMKRDDFVTFIMEAHNEGIKERGPNVFGDTMPDMVKGDRHWNDALKDHYTLVKEALDRGKPVSAEVLADYPEMMLTSATADTAPEDSPVDTGVSAPKTREQLDVGDKVYHPRTGEEGTIVSADASQLTVQGKDGKEYGISRDAAKLTPPTITPYDKRHAEVREEYNRKIAAIRNDLRSSDEWKKLRLQLASEHGRTPDDIDATVFDHWVAENPELQKLEVARAGALLAVDEEFGLLPWQKKQDEYITWYTQGDSELIPEAKAEHERSVKEAHAQRKTVSEENLKLYGLKPADTAPEAPPVDTVPAGEAEATDMTAKSIEEILKPHKATLPMQDYRAWIDSLAEGYRGNDATDEYNNPLRENVKRMLVYPGGLTEAQAERKVTEEEALFDGIAKKRSATRADFGLADTLTRLSSKARQVFTEKQYTGDKDFDIIEKAVAEGVLSKTPVTENGEPAFSFKKTGDLWQFLAEQEYYAETGITSTTKQPWQMTVEEYVGDKTGDALAVAKSAHPQHVKRALEEGKEVPREVLEQYKHNGWAKKALDAMGEAEAPDRPVQGAEAYMSGSVLTTVKDQHEHYDTGDRYLTHYGEQTIVQYIPELAAMFKGMEGPGYLVKATEDLTGSGPNDFIGAGIIKKDEIDDWIRKRDEVVKQEEKREAEKEADAAKQLEKDKVNYLGGFLDQYSTKRKAQVIKELTEKTYRYSVVPDGKEKTGTAKKMIEDIEPYIVRTAIKETDKGVFVHKEYRLFYDDGTFQTVKKAEYDYLKHIKEHGIPQMDAPSKKPAPTDKADDETKVQQTWDSLPVESRFTVATNYDWNNRDATRLSKQTWSELPPAARNVILRKYREAEGSLTGAPAKDPETVAEFVAALDAKHNPDAKHARIIGSIRLDTYDREITRLLQQLGINETGVRLGDAEETGLMRYMLAKGDITQDEWDKFVDELRKEGKVKAETPVAKLFPDQVNEQIVNTLRTDETLRTFVANKDNYKEDVIRVIERAVRKQIADIMVWAQKHDMLSGDWANPVQEQSNVDKLAENIYNSIKGSLLTTGGRGATIPAPKTRAETPPPAPTPEGPAKALKDDKDAAKARIAAMKARMAARQAKEDDKGELAFAEGRSHQELQTKSMVEYGVLGMEFYLEDDNITRDQWNEKMMEEYGPQLKLYLNAIHAFTEDMLAMTPDQLDQLVGFTAEEVGTDERTETGTPEQRSGDEALEDTQAEDAPGTGEGRKTGRGGPRGGRTDVGSPGEPAGGRPTAQPGVGDGKGDVDIPSGRTDDADTGGRPGDVEGASTRRGITGQNYRIDQEDKIDTRTKTQKLKDNLTAIRLLKHLQAEGQPATAEEQAVLVKYAGWGFYKDIFDQRYAEGHGLLETHEELKTLLTPDEWRAARASTLFAHYTGKQVIDGMYEALQEIGFTGGKILEPAMGVGHFFGLMPQRLAQASWITGVEIDSVSGNISKLLYPKANVKVQGYQDFGVPYDKTKLLNENEFDLVISNVPFSEVGITGDRRYGNVVDNLHNYFFVKAVDQVRPGGLVMFITSRYTMDSRDSTVREWINKKADFLGAVRLHNQAFKGMAETQVVTDVILLRKRADKERPAGEAWQGLFSTSKGETGEAWINEYYVNNPEMVLGKTEYIRGMYAEGEYAVTPDGRDLREAIRDAFATKVPRGSYKEREKHKATEAADPDAFMAAPVEAQPRSMLIRDGKIMVVVVDKRGRLALTPISKVRKVAEGGKVDKRIRGMIELRDVYNKLLNMELKGEPDKEVEPQRQLLNRVYDKFVRKHGPINDKGNSHAFNTDPGYYRLAGLELRVETGTGDKKKVTYKKNDVFTKRTVREYVAQTSADNPKEALLITLNEKGRVDVEHIAALSGKTADEVQKELAGLIYNDPQQGWVMADEYLSGNVREKLRLAEEAVKHDKSFAKNVEDLKEVQPKDLESHEIGIRMGVSWIPVDVYSKFLNDTFDGWGRMQVVHTPLTNTWQLTYRDDSTKQNVANNTANTQTYALSYRDPVHGMIRMKATKIILRMLNNEDMTVRVRVDTADGERYVAVPAATIALQEKAKQIERKFEQWLWSDEDRAKELTAKYNWEFNNSRKREFDGSHLTFPGMNPAITLGPHQANMVWRTVQARGSLAHHVVGAGKTYEMVAGAMELKRLGLAQKPLLVSPNHLIEQTTDEAQKLYPAAKILAYSPADLAANKRKIALARAAAGDWDLIIMPQSSYKMVPMSVEYVSEFVNGELDAIEAAIQAEREVRGDNDAIVRKIVTARNKLERKLTKHITRLKKMQDEGHMTFEETGADALFVDEAHHYKNLYYTTSMSNVGGLGSPEGSMQAFDMYTKVRYLREKRGGTGIVFVTGTPISNTMAEMYTMQRYLQPEELEARGLHTFDAWAQAFGRAVTAMELSPSGKGYRPKTRFSEFVNLPELLQMYHSFADVVNREKLLEMNPDMKIPKMKTGDRQLRKAPPSKELLEYIDELDDRAEACRSGAVDPKDDNFLKIVNDGRLAALYGPLRGLPDYKGSRINVAIDTIYDEWNENKAKRLTQLVFLDLSTPRGKTTQELEEDIEQDDDELVTAGATFEEMARNKQTVYSVMRKKLVKMGVPDREIAFIHDYSTDVQRRELFDAVRSGDIRILMGSTSKMGVGMNVQKKGNALHHIDAPWKPAEVEQREGRLIRQGNENEEVSIYCYGTERTLDIFMWQLIATKQKFIAQIERGDMSIRTAGDVDDMQLSASQIKAILTGNPLILEHVNIERRLLELAALEGAHRSQAATVAYDIKRHEKAIEEYGDAAEKYRKDLAKRKDIKGDKFTVKLFGEDYDERKKAAAVLVGEEGPLKVVFEQHAKHMDKKLDKRDFVAAIEKDGSVEISVVGTNYFIPVGDMAGFGLELLLPIEGKSQINARFNLRGVHYYYQTTVHDTGTGTLASLESTLRGFEGRVEDYEAKIKQSEDNLKSLKAEVGKAFEYERELIETNLRKEQIEAELGMHGEGAPTQRAPRDDRDEDDVDDDYVDDTDELGYTDEGVAIARATYRWTGAVGPRAITPRYVGEHVSKSAKILDYGAGKDAHHAKTLRDAGFLHVETHDFHAPNEKALRTKHDVTYASNVLNVQSSEDMLRETLEEIRGTTKVGGKFFANYPAEPRKMDLTPGQVKDVIEDVLGPAKRVGGTSSAPLWEVTVAEDTGELGFSVPETTLQQTRALQKTRDKHTPKEREKEAITRQAIIKKIEDYFGSMVRYGRFHGKDKAAIYKTKAELIRARTKYAQNLPILSHELGHHLEKLLGLLDIKVGDKELMQTDQVQLLINKGANVTKKRLRQEGIAEFIRLYLTDPAQAETDLPTFHEAFETRLVAYPDVQDKLWDLRADVQTYLTDKDVRGHVRGFVADEPKRKTTLNHLYSYVVDELDPVARFVRHFDPDEAITSDKDPYKKMRRAKGFHGRAHLLLQDGQYKKDAKTGDNIKVGPSLVEIKKPILALGEEATRDFDVYAILRRGIEIEESGRQSGLLDEAKEITLDVLKREVKELEKQYGDLFEQQQQALVGYSHFILEQLVGAGVLPRDLYNKIVEENPNYIPWNRVVPGQGHGRGDSGDRFGNRAKGVMRLKGADLPIRDFWQSIIRQTYSMTGLALKNDALLTLVNMKDIFHGTGQFFDHVPAPKIPFKARISVEEMLEHLEKMGADVEEPEKDLQALLLTFFKPEQRGNVSKNLVTVWRDGVPEFYEFVDTDLMKAVMHMDSDQTTALGKVGRFFANLMRVGHTVNPRFIFYNPARDQFLAAAYSKSGYIPWVDFMKGLFQVLGRGEYYKQWMLEGGAMTTYDSFDKDYMSKDLKGFTERKWTEMMATAINPLTHLRYAAMLSEYSTNLGETMKARQKGADWLDAVMAGRDITVDHKRHGSKSQAARDFIPFINSAIQGHDKMVREFRKNPGRTFLRFLLFITLPSLALYVLNRKNPNYQELPAWRKDLFWNIPVGNPLKTKYFIPYPKPFVPGLLFGSMPERFAHWLETKDEKAFHGFIKNLSKMAAPNTTILPIELGYEWAANWNFYSKAPIVPMREQRLPAAQQYGPYTSETAKLIGKLGVSPRKVDHTIRKTTGLLGATGTGSLDALLHVAGLADKTPKPLRDVTDLWIVGDFFTAARSGGAYSIDQFYVDLRKAELAYNREGGPKPDEVKSLTMLPVMRKIERELGDLRSMVRDVHGSAALTPEQKREILDHLELQQINMVRLYYGREPITWD